jgi:hypothetical protein
MTFSMLGGGVCSVAVGEMVVGRIGVWAGLPQETGMIAQINSAGKCHGRL